MSSKPRTLRFNGPQFSDIGQDSTDPVLPAFIIHRWGYLNNVVWVTTLLAKEMAKAHTQMLS